MGEMTSMKKEMVSMCVKQEETKAKLRGKTKIMKVEVNIMLNIHIHIQ